MSALCPGRQIEHGVAAHCRHAHLRAEHELRVGDESFRVEILALALEAWIIGHVEQHVNVAAWSIARSGVADAAKRDELPEERPLRAPNLALTAASRAYLRPGARLRARPRTDLAGIEKFDLNFLIDACRDFGQRQRYFNLDVGS